MRIGFAPDLISFTISVFSPIAPIAMMIMNLLKSFIGVKKEDGTLKKLVQIVVNREAAMNQRIKNGKIFLKSTFFPVFASCFVRMNASTRVIGIIASVLVSLTVTALSSVALPSWYMLSQVEAHAVTEEVSFTAVPAKMPNASPLVVEKPNAVPRCGKISAARTLNKKITLIACATSSSSASMTGAVAAMALPPQMELPTPIKVLIFPGTCKHLCNW